MASNVTLKTLVDRVLDLADMPGADYPDRNRVTDLINEGLSEIHEVLASGEYKWKSHPFSAQAGVEQYDLPNDFYRSHKLWRTSSNRRYPVHKYTISELAGHQATGPQSSGTFELWYIPAFEPLVNDSDQVDESLHYGWEMYAVYHAAAQLLNREESATAQSYVGERARIMSRIAEHAAPRDFGEPDAIEDIYGRWGSGVYDDDRRAVRYRIMGSKIFLSEFDYTGV